MTKLKILTFDIETSPIEFYGWGMRDQNFSLDHIKKDWHILAWAAKWLDEPPSKVIYMDNSKAKNVQNDKRLVRELAHLINQADFIITQNGDRFDVRKLNARAVINGLPPIKPCQSIDILKEERKVFGFTSHKLEYKTAKINKKYKKLKHGKFPGIELWKEVVNGNQKAWKEMKKYTIYDVLSTEEHFNLVRSWIKTPNFSTYFHDGVLRCKCGSKSLRKEGYARTDAGKYQIYQCRNCGKWPRSPVNLLSERNRRKIVREYRGAR